MSSSAARSRPELRRFIQLTWLAAVGDFRRSYVDSHLGYLWMVIQPLLFFAVLYVVFTRVVRFGGEVAAYPMMLLLNIVMIRFFAEATNRSTRSLVSRSGLIRKMKFPRAVLPCSTVLQVFFVLLANIGVALVWFLFYGIEPTWTWLLLPVLLAALFAVTMTVSILLASLYVPIRDVSQVWMPINRALFYATPVIFPIEFVPDGILRTIVSFNPLAPIFVEARVWLIDPDAPGWIEASGSTLNALLPLLVFAVIAIATVYAFRFSSKRVAELA